jgi:hypothetical protein
LPAVRRKQLEKYHADCRYWWRLENDKNQLIVQKNSSPFYDIRDSFENVDVYDISDINEIFSPSAAIHAWLLVNVLTELTESEKNDWDKYVLKHWSLLSTPLYNALMAKSGKYHAKILEDPRFEMTDTHVEIFYRALDSVARLKYGLSDPPTEEECRQLLKNWVNQSIDNQQPFTMTHRYIKLFDVFSTNRVSTDNEVPLINTAIKLMGETVRKPLAEQWRTNYYRFENGWVPLLYVSGMDCGKEYFDDMVRYFATTYNGQVELLKNQNEQVIPLFKTLLYRKNFLDFVKPDAKRYQQSIIDSIIVYNYADNPLLDAAFHEYLAYVLSDPKFQGTDREKFEAAIVRAISARFWRMSKDELTALITSITSLPLDQTSKDLLLRKFRSQYIVADGAIGDGISWLSYLLQQAAGHTISIETKKTVEEVNCWFAENPDGTLHQFFKIFANDFELRDRINATKTLKTDTDNLVPIFSSDRHFVGNPSPMDDRLPQWLVTALLTTDTPETQKTIKQLCNNETDRELVLAAIISRFSSRIESYHKIEFSFEYLSYLSINYPDYILDIIETLNEKECVELVSGLVLCSFPRAEQILEKWSQTENEQLKQKITHCLKIRQQRKMIGERTKELFYELVEEKIQPDDLLVSQTPYVWKDGKYVH